jgi:hypothetical protein
MLDACKALCGRMDLWCYGFMHIILKVLATTLNQEVVPLGKHMSGVTHKGIMP